MRRVIGGAVELDDDPARLDLEVVHAFLTSAYWAEGRSRETVERLVTSASRVVGLYEGDATIGFCRVVSDGETFAFLMDVFVLPDHRGRGLGVELVREAVDNGPHRDLRWHLGTSDAHGLYRRFGFEPADPERQMVRRPRRSS
jgi:GNAT superfamily N-acetyltransferase